MCTPSNPLTKIGSHAGYGWVWLGEYLLIFVNPEVGELACTKMSATVNALHSAVESNLVGQTTPSHVQHVIRSKSSGSPPS